MKKLLAMMTLAGLVGSAQAEFTCSAQVEKAASEGAVQTGVLTWKNTGSAIAAPYVRLEAGEGVLVRFTEADAWTKSLEFLATGSDVPVSRIGASASGTVPFLCKSASKDGKLELSWTLSSAEAFPWTELGAAMRPSAVPNEAWAFAMDTLKMRLGATWDTYLARFREDADYLAELGRPVNRIDRLWQFEINLALGNDPVLPTLAAAQDAARSARGLELSFSRAYLSSLSSRFSKGIFGYGWSDNYSTYAELTDEKTLVFRIPGGGSYSFTKATGSWDPEDARDRTKLTETGDTYALAYQDGSVQTFSKGNMRTASIADNQGNALTFAWNGTRLQKVTHTDGQFLAFAYENGLVASVTDDCGRKTTYVYSGDLLASVTSSDGLVTKYAYRSADGTAAARALTKITYPDGTTREFAYDGDGLVASVSVNGGREKTSIVREAGVVTVTSPNGRVTVLKTGVSGEALEATDALGGVTTNGYTEDGLLASAVSPSGLRGEISHDALGRVTKTVSASGAATEFSYDDAFGNLLAVQDAKGQSVTYGYDKLGRGTSVAFPDGSSSKVEYDARGDVVKSTNRRGESVTCTYDDFGRLTGKRWSNGRTFAYAYDARGNLTSASDSETGAVGMQYDAADRLTRIVYPNRCGFTFTYDSCGRLVRRMSLDGAAEIFTYDASGRLVEVGDGNGTTYLRNAYDAATGRLTQQTYGNGTRVDYLYDLMGRVVSIEHRDASGKVLEALQYCYDADGRCLRASSLLGEERYGYDKDGQLTSVDYPVGDDETFAYDAVGNRTSANGVAYTVNKMNQYTRVGSDELKYDTDGNLVSVKDAKGTTTYAYDTLNRLVSVKNAAAGIDWSCTYDALGNRVSVTDNGVTTERVYLPGSLPSVAAEYVNGKLSSRHVLVGAVRVADLNDTIRYYHADLIGSTRLTTDAAGQVTGRAAYKAFGDLRAAFADVGSAGYVGTLGVETDPTGLLFMRNRYYSPALGRFIQPDPIGMSGGDVNWYRYCGNGVITHTDILGRLTEPDKYTKMGVSQFLGLIASLQIPDVSLAANVIGKVNTIASIADSALSGDMEDATLTVFKGAASLFGSPVAIFIAFWDVVSAQVDDVMEDVGYNDLMNSLNTENWDVDLNSGCYSGNVSMNCWKVENGEVVKVACETTGVQIPMKCQEVVEIGGGDDPTPGPDDEDDPAPGPGPSGGGSIKSEDDWLRISTNVNARTATFSVGANLILTDARCAVVNFSGTVLGNGYSITCDGGVSSKSLFGVSDNGATFDSLVIKDGWLASSFNNSTFRKCRVECSGQTFAMRASGCTFDTIDFKNNWVADNVEGCMFRNCQTEASGEFCAGFANTAVGCVFDACTVSASIASVAKSYGTAGGFVCTAENCEFSNCRVTGTISAESDAGLLAGRTEGGKVTGCQASGRVTSTGSLVGGLVGESSGTQFISCTDVNVEVTGNGDVGGFVGCCIGLSSFSDCRALGNVTGYRNVGGFVGLAKDQSEFSSCTAQGKVTGVPSGSKNGSSVGGFGGDVSGGCKLSSCKATGIVSASGCSKIGGFLGATAAVSKGAPTINSCTASGAVLGGSFVGGFVGSPTGGAFAGCTSSGSVTADGDGTGIIYAGGFAGMSETTTSIMGTTYKNCKATGKPTVTGSGMIFKGDFAPSDMPSGGFPFAMQAKSAVQLSAVSAKILSEKSSAMASPRLCSYERYVVVKGYDYSFALSADEGANVSVSGLPAGFAFAGGIISGKASAVGSQTVTISAAGSDGSVTKDVIFEVIEAPKGFAEQFASSGGDVPEPPTSADGTYTTTIDGIEWTYTIENGMATLRGITDGEGTRAVIPTNTTGRVVIPSSFGGCALRKICYNAFWHCERITSVEIPDCVRNLETQSFFRCDSLERVEIPEGVTRIYQSAFYNCKRLSSVVIPKSVTFMGNDRDGNPFDACPKLEVIEVRPGNEKYKVVDRMVLTADGKTLISVPSAWTTVVVPAGVEELARNAVNGNTELCSLTLPESLRRITDGLGWGCMNLERLVIPAAVAELGENAFGNLGVKTVVDFMGAPPGGTDAVSSHALTATYASPFVAEWENVIESDGTWRGLSMKRGDGEPLEIYDDLDQAKNAAIREGKLVFLVSGANWCPYTTKLKQYVVDAGSTFTDNYVYLWHDQDKDPFGIAEMSSVPEFWIFQPSDLDLSTKSSWDTIALFNCSGCPTDYAYFLRVLESVAESKPANAMPLSLAGAGWHEVSFSVLPAGGKPEDVFAPVAGKIGYVTYGSKNWSPAGGGTLTALEIGKGYWVQTTAENVAWTVTGQGNPGVEIVLKPGWNLIGYPLLEEGEVETVLATALATGNIRYISSGSRVYPGTLKTMAPGKGYWVYAEAAATIKFDFNK